LYDNFYDGRDPQLIEGWKFSIRILILIFVL
jgi:hypothetical protein